MAEPDLRSAWMDEDIPEELSIKLTGIILSSYFYQFINSNKMAFYISVLFLHFLFSNPISYSIENSIAGVNLRDTVKLPPLETQAANTSYKPAFAGQTRIFGTKTTAKYKVEKINSELKSPWAIIPLPDNRLLVTAKSGYMQILDANGTIQKKIVGFPEVRSGGQGGLLDVALDPMFSTNKMMYWSF